MSLRFAVHGGVGRALFAQVLDHRIDVADADFSRRPLDVETVDALQLDLRQHFEHGPIFEVGALLQIDRLDARPAGRCQLFLYDRLIKGGLHDVAQHFLADLLAELLPHHFHRHLAGAEAFQAHGAAHALQPLVHGLFNAFGRNLHFHPALQGAGRFN